MARSAAEIREDINQLRNRLMMKEVDLEEYYTEMEQLENKLRNVIKIETYVTPVDPKQTEEQLQYNIETQLRGEGKYTTPKEIDPEKAKKRAEELGIAVEDLSSSEQAKLQDESVREFQKKIEPEQFETQKYKDVLDPKVSAIVDAKAGLIKDRETGKRRKASGVKAKEIIPFNTIAGAITSNPVLSNAITSGLNSLFNYTGLGEKEVIASPKAELFVEALKQQRKQTPRQKKRMDDIKKATAEAQENSLRKNLIKKGLSTREVTNKVLEYRKNKKGFWENNPNLDYGLTAVGLDLESPDLEGGIVETPLGTGLRLLNTTSAFVAPVLDGLNDLLQTDEGRSVAASTVTANLPPVLRGLASEGLEEVLDENLSPISTREGAGYEKTEMDGVFAQGLTNMILGQGLFSQLGAQSQPPETNYNWYDPTVQGSIANMFAGLSGEVVADPLLPFTGVAQAGKVGARALRFTGQRASLERALKPFTEITGVKPTKKLSMMDEVFEPETVVYKGADMGADIVAGAKLLSRYDDPALGRWAGQKAPIQNSSTINTVYKTAKDLQDVRNITKKINAVVKGSEDPVLRGVDRVADETLRVLETGAAPKIAKDLINRGIQTSRLRNIPVEEIDKVVATKSKEVVEAWSKTYALLKQSTRRPLNAKESDRLIKSVYVLRKNKVYDDLPNKVKNSPQVVYDAVHSNASQIIRDNMMRSIPADLVYMSNNVAVPKNMLYTFTGRKKPQYQRFLNERRKLLKYESVADGLEEGYKIMPESESALYIFQKQTGMSVSPEIEMKLVFGNPLTPTEFKQLESSVAAELALKHLNGTRLRTAGMTSALAKSSGAISDTLAPMVSGVESTFVIKAKGIANAIRLSLAKASKPIPNLFGTEASASFKMFENEMKVARNSAAKQVTDTYATAQLGEKSSDSFAVTSKSYMDKEVAFKLGQSESKAIRSSQPQIADVGPTVRKDFVGDSPYAKPIKERLKNKIEQARRNREALKRKKVEGLSRLRKSQEESIVKLTQKQSTSLKKLRNKKAKLEKIFDKIVKQQEVLNKRLKQQEKIFDKRVNKSVEILLKKANDDKARFLKAQEEVDRRIFDIEQQQLAKSKETAKKRKLQSLGERFGQSRVKEVIEEETGLTNLTYDDLAVVIDDVQDRLVLYEEGIIRKGQWDYVINRFFTTPEGSGTTTAKLLEPVRQFDEYINAIKIDPDLPFFAPNNLRDINPSSLKEVVTKLRNSPKGELLKDYGLKGFFTNDENFVLPIIDKSVSIQMGINANKSIKKFVNQESDLVMQMNRTQENMVGLKTTEAMSKVLAKNITDTIQASGVSDDVIDLIVYQTKELLFDGMMRDVWVNTSRATQKSFIQSYLNEMVASEGAVVNMDEFLKQMLKKPELGSSVIKSSTFQNINNRIEKILDRTIQRLEYKKGAKDITPEQLTQIESQQVAIEKVVDEFPTVLEKINTEYLSKLLGLSDEILDDTIFGTQLQQVNDRIGMYGFNANYTSDYIKKAAPRIEMLGYKNIGLVYGNDVADAAKQIVEMSKSKNFDKIFNQLAKNKQLGINQPEHILLETIGLIRRFTQANMLGGLAAPNLRFYGFNRLTAPIILATSALNAPLRAKSAALIVGRAFDMGLLGAAKKSKAYETAVNILGKPSITDLHAANKYMTAPPEEIVVFAKDGARRDYTAGELRRADVDNGLAYSRADQDFFETEVNQMMINLGINKQGFDRYVLRGFQKQPLLYKPLKKLYERLSPNLKNYNTDLAKYQDAELRRIVFVEYLKNGYSMDEALSAGKASMLDYTTLKSWEKQYLSRGIWFYAFQRTMAMSQINAIYKGVVTGKPSLSVKMLRSQDALNRAMAKDYADYSDQQLGRLFNMFAGEVEGVGTTLSGPPNPQMQVFELMMDGVLHADNPLGVAVSSLVNIFEDNPFYGQIIKGAKAGFTGRVPAFPAHLIYGAEARGNLDYLIKRYNLVSKKQYTKRAGRPLTLGVGDVEPGVFYDFRDGDAGVKDYYQFLFDQSTAQAGFEMRVGIGAQSLFGERFNRDWIKSLMLSAKRGDKVLTREGEKVLPFESEYLKTGTIQGGKPAEVFDGATQNGLLQLLYQLGTVTQLRNADLEREIMWSLKNTQRVLKEEADKESQ